MNKRENGASQNKSSGNTPQTETPKVLVLLLMLQPENCHQGNPGNVENQAGFYLGLEHKFKTAGVGKGGPVLASHRFPSSQEASE